MQRAAGGGTVIGGTYQKGSWESQPDPNQALRIMKRAVEICPTLTDGKGIEALSVIRHAVGLRPLRVSGVRLEREKVDGVEVVHNYGHGGWGMFFSSFFSFGLVGSLLCGRGFYVGGLWFAMYCAFTREVTDLVGIGANFTTGYQGSYGCSEGAVELVDEALKPRAKL